MNKRNYQQIKTELDQVIEQLESAGEDIDKSIELFERANRLIGELEKYLKASEAKINKLKK